jgi:hypothetical protein
MKETTAVKLGAERIGGGAIAFTLLLDLQLLLLLWASCETTILEDGAHDR